LEISPVRNTRLWKFAAAALVVAALLLAPQPMTAEEEDFIEVLTADLTTATKVVVGVVKHAQPSINGTTSHITSRINLQPSVTLKGSHSNATITFDIPGGTVGDLTMDASHIPLLTSGDRVLIMLDAEGARVAGETIFKLTGNGNDSDAMDGTSLSLQDVRDIVDAL
jgi:hypothetical protein